MYYTANLFDLIYPKSEVFFTIVISNIQEEFACICMLITFHSGPYIIMQIKTMLPGVERCIVSNTEIVTVTSKSKSDYPPVKIVV